MDISLKKNLHILRALELGASTLFGTSASRLPPLKYQTKTLNYIQPWLLNHVRKDGFKLEGVNSLKRNYFKKQSIVYTSLQILKLNLKRLKIERMHVYTGSL